MKTLEEEFKSAEFLKAIQLVTCLGYETERFELENIQEAREHLAESTERRPTAVKIVYKNFESRIIRVK